MPFDAVYFIHHAPVWRTNNLRMNQIQINELMNTFVFADSVEVNTGINDFEYVNIGCGYVNKSSLIDPLSLNSFGNVALRDVSYKYIELIGQYKTVFNISNISNIQELANTFYKDKINLNNIQYDKFYNIFEKEPKQSIYFYRSSKPKLQKSIEDRTNSIEFNKYLSIDKHREIKKLQLEKNDKDILTYQGLVTYLQYLLAEIQANVLEINSLNSLNNIEFNTVENTYVSLLESKLFELLKEKLTNKTLKYKSTNSDIEDQIKNHFKYCKAKIKDKFTSNINTTINTEEDINECTTKKPDIPVVVKEVQILLTNQLEAKRIINELITLKTTFPHIQPLLGMTMTSEDIKFVTSLINCDTFNGIHTLLANSPFITIYLIFEYINSVNLSDLIESRGPLEEYECIAIIRSILFALNYLHTEKGITHNNINPQNIFIHGSKYHDAHIRLIEPLLTKGSKIEHLHNTLYTAPEVMQGHMHSVHSDLFSLGILMQYLLVKDINLLKKQWMHDSCNTKGKLLNKSIQAETKLPQVIVPSYISKEAIDIINSLISVNPTQRISIVEIVSSSLFCKYENFHNLFSIKKICPLKIRSKLSEIDSHTFDQYYEMKDNMFMKFDSFSSLCSNSTSLIGNNRYSISKESCTYLTTESSLCSDKHVDPRIPGLKSQNHMPFIQEPMYQGDTATINLNSLSAVPIKEFFK